LERRVTYLSELAGRRELMNNLTLRELRGKYKRSALGWAWSLLNPISMMLIYSLVFGYILRIKVDPGHPSGLQNFSFFLLCGLLSWNFLSNGMTASMVSLLGNANLIKKVYFPREILPAAAVAAAGVTFLIEFSVLAVALLIFGNMVLPWLPLVLLLIALQGMFVLGVGLALSILNVYFRDVQHLVAIALQVWFYASPIVYPITLVPEHQPIWGHSVPLRAIYELNPMVRFIEAYRNVLYDLRFPSAGTLLYIVVSSVVSLAIGVWVFRRFDPRLAEEL
jgi:ABC-type polysaccharide/polyol phosphate export permease